MFTKKNIIRSSAAVGAIALTLATTSVVLADTATIRGEMGRGRGPERGHMASSSPAWAQGKDMDRGMMARPEMMKSAVVGQVTAINGTILSVLGHVPERNVASSTYAVDASTAVVIKAGATSTLSSIAVNDHVAVQGTISSSTVKANLILTGMPGPKEGMMRPNDNHRNWASSSTSTKPGVMGGIGQFFKKLFHR